LGPAYGSTVGPQAQRHTKLRHCRHARHDPSAATTLPANPDAAGWFSKPEPWSRRRSRIHTVRQIVQVPSQTGFFPA